MLSNREVDPRKVSSTTKTNPYEIHPKNLLVTGWTFLDFIIAVKASDTLSAV